jgi:hypothetical protein
VLDGLNPVPSFFVVQRTILAVAALFEGHTTPPLLVQHAQLNTVGTDGVRVHNLQPTCPQIDRTDSSEILVPLAVGELQARAIDRNMHVVCPAAAFRRRVPYGTNKRHVIHDFIRKQVVRALSLALVRNTCVTFPAGRTTSVLAMRTTAPYGVCRPVLYPRTRRAPIPLPLSCRLSFTHNRNCPREIPGKFDFRSMLSPISGGMAEHEVRA